MFPPATNNSLLILATVIAEIVSSFNGGKVTAGELPISKQIISNSTRIAQAVKFIQAGPARMPTANTYTQLGYLRSYVASYIV